MRNVSPLVIVLVTVALFLDAMGSATAGHGADQVDPGPDGRRLLVTGV